MKKFLVYLCVIIVAVSTGFAVFFLVRDNEVISLSTTSLYKDVGSKFELSLDISHPNSYTTIELESSNTDVLTIEDEEINVDDKIAKASFVANKGGVSRVNFKTNNSKFRNLYCDVVIGDGSAEFPFYISTAKQLAQIGAELTDENGTAIENPYTLASCYELVADIDMSELGTTWLPFGTTDGTPYTGIFEGNGYTIYNLNIKGVNGKNVGLFSSIGSTGTVKNVKFENAEIHVSQNNEYVGLIAGVNQGVIERVEIKDVEIYNKENTAVYMGGAVGLNKSLNTATGKSSAKIDRVSVNVNFYADPAEVDEETGEVTTEATTNVAGKIGGLAAYNLGGTVRFSYAIGKAEITSVAQMGGLIHTNEYLVNDGVSRATAQYSKNMGANVMDCYSAMDIECTLLDPENDTQIVTGLILNNIDSDINKIWGNYYIEDYIPSICNGINGYSDAQYFCEAKSESELKTTTLLSHKSYKLVLENGVITEQEDGDIYWNVQVWHIDGSNNGFPVLNFAKQEIADDEKLATDITSVTNAEELRNAFAAGMDASIAVVADIDLSNSEWVPIGTELAPFIGNLVVLENPETGKPFTISGLKVTSNAYDYAGFFGVLGNGARVDGLTLVNPEISNDLHGYVGAIAGANGVVVGKQIQGGQLTNCNVYGGNLNGKAVGGVAGQNAGIIAGCEVYGAHNNNGVAPLIISASCAGSGKNTISYIGGIVAINAGSVYGKEGDFSVVEGNIMLTASETGNGKVYVGGIAGKNNGTINYVKVNILTNDDQVNYGIMLSNNLVAYAGGVAGYSDGHINTAIISVRIITGSENNSNYAGGVVGYFAKDGAEDTININNAKVYNSYIQSTNAAGLVGYLSGSSLAKVKVDKGSFIQYAWSEIYTISDEYYKQDSLVANLAGSSVADSVTLSGKNVAGFVTELQRGYVTDCYSKAILSGTNSAGMVYTISYDRINGTGGVVNRCYVIAQFEGATNKYSVTSSIIHSQNNMDKRTAGFIDEYYFVDMDGKAQNPEYFTSATSGVVNFFIGIFGDDADKKVTRERKIETLKDVEIWDEYATINEVTGANPWYITDGEVPSLDIDTKYNIYFGS